MDRGAAQVRVVLAELELVGRLLFVLLSDIAARGLALFAGFRALKRYNNAISLLGHSRENSGTFCAVKVAEA
jgi:hypothetical protein